MNAWLFAYVCAKNLKKSSSGDFEYECEVKVLKCSLSSNGYDATTENMIFQILVIGIIPDPA